MREVSAMVAIKLFRHGAFKKEPSANQLIPLSRHPRRERPTPYIPLQARSPLQEPPLRLEQLLRSGGNLVIQQVDRKHNNLFIKADGNKSLTTLTVLMS